MNKTFRLCECCRGSISGFLMDLDVYIPMWMQGSLRKASRNWWFGLSADVDCMDVRVLLSGQLLRKYSAKWIIVSGLIIILIGGGT